jgi:hypothetical protein
MIARKGGDVPQVIPATHSHGFSGFKRVVLTSEPLKEAGNATEVNSAREARGNQDPYRR